MSEKTWDSPKGGYAVLEMSNRTDCSSNGRVGEAVLLSESSDNSTGLVLITDPFTPQELSVRPNPNSIGSVRVAVAFFENRPSSL